jgi:hypothetical protein
MEDMDVGQGGLVVFAKARRTMGYSAEVFGGQIPYAESDAEALRQ